MVARKNTVVAALVKGVATLFKAWNIECHVQGTGLLRDRQTITVTGADGVDAGHPGRRHRSCDWIFLAATAAVSYRRPADLTSQQRSTLKSFRAVADRRRGCRGM